MAHRAVYRDRETGQFVSKAAWERSHGPQGDYTRSYYEYEEGYGEDFEFDIDLGEDEY